MKTTWIRFVDARRTRSVFLAVRVVRGISKLRDGAMCRKGGERVIPHTIGLLYNERYIKARKPGTVGTCKHCTDGVPREQGAHHLNSKLLFISIKVRKVQGGHYYKW